MQWAFTAVGTRYVLKREKENMCDYTVCKNISLIKKWCVIKFHAMHLTGCEVS